MEVLGDSLSALAYVAACKQEMVSHYEHLLPGGLIGANLKLGILHAKTVKPIYITNPNDLNYIPENVSRLLSSLQNVNFVGRVAISSELQSAMKDKTKRL